MASFYENISGYTVTQTDKAYFTDIDVANEITVNGVAVDLVTLADLVNTPTFTGSISSLGLSVGDNNLINVGAGNDLQIYHDGSHSYIKDAGTGDLKIQGGNVAIQNISGGNIFFANSQAAFLDWRGTNGAGTKLQTTETGINVTGTVTADGVSLANDKRITLGAEAGSNYLEIFESTTGNGVIKQVGAGDFAIQGHAIQLKDDDGNLRFQGTNGAFGNAFLYYGADATPKLNTTSAGINVTGTVTADGVTVGAGTNGQLDITSDANNTYITQTTTTGNIYLDANNFVVRDPTDDSYRINAGDGDGVKLYSNNAKRVEVGSVTEGVRLLTGAQGSEVVGFEVKDAGVYAQSAVVITDPNPRLILKDSTDSDDHSIKFRGSDDADNLQITSASNHLNFITADSNKNILMKPNGATALEVNTTGIDVTGTVTCDEALTISSTGAGADAKPDIFLYNNATAADGERLGQITYFGKNSATETTNYGWHEVKTVDVTDGAEDSVMEFWVRNGAGNHNKSLTLNKDGIDVTGTVEADAFSGTGNTSITNFITDVSTNNNDTTVPTTAAVKTYVDANAAGGGETLEQTLALGASTGGTDLAVSAGDNIVFSDTSKAIFQDEDGDPKLEIYSDAGSSNRSTIKSTGVSLYLEAPHINYNSGGNQYFRTSFSAGTAQFTIDGSSASTTTRGSIIQEATNSYTGSISAQTANITGGSAIPVIDCHKNVSTSNGDTLGSLKYFGENSSGQKSYYGEMLCKASNTSASGNQVGQLEWYIADGSGQTVPVTNVNADNAGKKLAMVVGNTFTGFYGGNQLYLEGTNSSGDKGYLNFGNYQSLRPPLTGDTSKIYLPQTDADKVMSVGGIGATDSWIFGTTMSETDFLKYRGQHMVRYGTTATVTATFDLPRVQATNSGHSTTLGNIGDIYTISNVVGGALTIDRDASGTAQAVYELNGSSLVAFTNNPTISVGGSITLQAVGTNTYLITNAKGLTDA